MAGVLKYTVVRVNPETGVATALKEGTTVPEWAKELVFDDDLVEAAPAPDPSPADASGDERVRKAEEAEEAAAADLKAAQDRIAELEGELKTVTAEKFAALGHPQGDPSESWKVAEFEAYAASKNVDISSAKNNGERIALIAAATPAS